MERIVEVRETTVGAGVFALRSIKCGARIGTILGRLVEDEDEASDYAMDFSDELMLDPDPPYRFLNHACEPNCELVLWEGEELRDSEMALHALRAIEPGEQLTIDYAWPADHAIRCLCEQPGCRGWIVSADEVSLLAGAAPERNAAQP